MADLFSLMRKAALNLLFPLQCQACQGMLEYDYGNFLCERCSQKLISTSTAACTQAQAGLFFDRAYHCCFYDGIIKTLIQRYKYHKKAFLKDIFISLMHREFQKAGLQQGIDTIIPVPMHIQDEKRRGFNQSMLLAKGVSEKTGIACQDILLKRKKTRAQAGLKKSERSVNIKNAFVINGRQKISGKRLLIIDDVFTTGATINECAKTLKTHGADSVLALTLAKGI
jgi:competence protein ComFC